MNWTLIESDAALVQLLASAAGSPAVMVDTEFMRRNTFFPQVALVQLCFTGCDAAGTAWLLDPLQIEDTAQLVALLENPDVVKVLHSASEDLEVFQQWLGALPSPLFDTQRAAALVGLGFGLGYRALVQVLCDEDLPKGETRSNWLQRPLSESQCHYAAQDVSWLLEAYTVIAARCRDRGRFDWVLEDGEMACRGLASMADGYYKRIKGAWKLAPRELAMLIAICDWREDTARKKDKPRSWIIDDKACLQLAQSRPADMNALRAAVDLHPSTLRRYAEPLLRLIASQPERDDAPLPASLPAPLSVPQRKTLKRLKQETEQIARRLDVAPQILVAGKDFEALIRGDAEQPDYWSGWRREQVIDPLLALLDSEVA